MSTPKWTPELEARCLAAVRAARSEPETDESLRWQLSAERSARLAAEERLAAQQPIMDALNRSRETMARRIIAVEVRARVLGEAATRLLTVLDARDGWIRELYESEADGLRVALASLPTAPAEEPTK